MEDAQETRLRSQPLGIHCEIPQGGAGLSEHLLEEELAVVEEHDVEFAGDAEDHVEIRHRQEPFLLAIEPVVAAGGLTDGTMAVAATVVNGVNFLTPRTVPLVLAQGRGPTDLDGPGCAPLFGGHLRVPAINRMEPSKDLGERRPLEHLHGGNSTLISPKRQSFLEGESTCQDAQAAVLCALSPAARANHQRNENARFVQR